MADNDAPTPVVPGQPWALAGSAPVPDPTKLTTEAVNAATGILKELFDSKLDGLLDLIEEKFASVEDKLALGEKLRVEQKADTEKAIQAALLAQKEAVAAQAASFAESVDKSEKATAKQLDQMASTSKVEIQSVANSLGELKDRVVTLEANSTGRQEQRVEGRASLASIVGVAAGVVGILSLVAMVIIASLPG